MAREPALPAPHPRVLQRAALDGRQNTPSSRHYGDRYFAPDGGAEQARTVFLEGNELPQRWRGRARFCIGELGFGSGLNFAMSRQAFLRTQPGHAQLDYVSFERHPLASVDQQRMIREVARTSPALAQGMRQLAAVMPPALAGWHRRTFDGGRVRLSLFLGDAADGLDDWQAWQGGAADAWYLDGFDPDCKPSLWTADLPRQLRHCSHNGATAASYPVARTVQEHLADAGFEVWVDPAAAGKRQALRARLLPSADRPAAADTRARRVAIVGGGLAGATSAAALAQRGIEVTVFESSQPASGASGNPWAIMHPRLPLDDGPRGPLLASCYAFARSWLAHRPGWQLRPVVQLPEVRRPQRLQKVLARYADSGDWLQPQILSSLQALRFPAAGHAALPTLIAALLEHPRVTVRNDCRIDRPADLAARDYDACIVATGAAGELIPEWLPIGRMRGQLTRVRAVGSAGRDLPVVTGRGHVLPLVDGWVCGASYERDGAATVATTTEQQANLARLDRLLDLAAPGAARPMGNHWQVVEDFVGVRANLPDRLPAVGSVGDSCWLNLAHSSSGLLTCPFSAELLASRLCDEPPAADREMRAALAPSRFRPG